MPAAEQPLSGKALPTALSSFHHGKIHQSPPFSSSEAAKDADQGQYSNLRPPKRFANREMGSGGQPIPTKVKKNQMELEEKEPPFVKE